MKIGATIRAFREEIGMNQTELAYESKLARNTIISYEQDKRSPRVDDLEQIAAALKISAWKIMERASKGESI